MVKSFFVYLTRGSLASLLGARVGEASGPRIQAFRVNKKASRQLEDTGYLPTVEFHAAPRGVNNPTSL